MNPENKKIAEAVIEVFKKTDKSKLTAADDLRHLLPDRETAEKIIYPLEKDFGLIERSGKYAFRLTNKGWKFTTFDKLEKESKKTPLNTYQKVHIGLTCLSIITVIVLWILNYSIGLEKSDLIKQNNLLSDKYNIVKTDLVRYRDSLNVYKEKVSIKIPTQ